MSKILSIVRYEYKMQFGRIATWGIFILATVIALLDNFPSAKNHARLEFLTQPSYYVYRTMGLDGLIISFGLIFLLSYRIPVDNKTGCKALLMAAPISKGQYVLGKLLGGFAYSMTIISAFLILNTAIYAAFTPIESAVMEYVGPLLIALIVIGIPVSFFTSFLSITLPVIIDIRLFYLLIAVLFLLNAGSVSSSEAMPFYLITSGDLIKLVWQHPKFPFSNTFSIAANLTFLIGCGLLSWALLMLKRKFWRAE